MDVMHDLKSLARDIAERKKAVALTGAGISVASGIPDFRSPGGLWEKFDPMEYATIEAFRSDPRKVWKMLREMDQLVLQAEPNPAHLALAKLEQLGVLVGIITQNIDNLHQKAGSSNVVEFHGNAEKLVCLACNYSTGADDARRRSDDVPSCPECGAVMKPDVVFFGEAIAPEASSAAMQLVQGCGVMLVVGTSAVVAPASYLPVVARKMGALVAEINLEPTVLTDRVAHVSLIGDATKLLPELASEVEALVS